MPIPQVYRQFLVAISPQLASFSMGAAVTFPTVLIEQFKTNETSIHLDVDTRSWIGSIYGVAGIPAVLMPIITQKFGRKVGFILTCMYIMIGWILAYTASTATAILVSECSLALGINSLLPISFIGMTEMLAPSYRFIAMQTFGLVQVVGMAVGGILGKYISYKTLCVIMFIPIVAATLIALVWPESPSWLALKGEFDKCEKAFLWLRGSDEASKKELRELIVAHRENLKKTSQKLTLRSFWKKISHRDFYMPSLHGFLLLNLMYWSGVDVILIYFCDMVEKATGNPNAAFYGIVSMYSIDLVGAFITNYLIRRFKNKSVLLFSTFGVIACLFAAFVVTALQSAGVVSKSSLLSMYCLLVFMAFNSMGLNCLVFVIGMELIPVKHRNLGGSLFIVYNCVLYVFTLKTAPYLFESLNMWGTYLLYTINGIICALLVKRFVPETKNRTLLEIENFYAHGDFVYNTTVGGNLSPLIA